ncbi:hypothetical protein REPUB_Repub17cG0136900 [Reevesia pubescens]
MIAAIEAIKFAGEMRFNSIIMEGDALKVVNSLRQEDSDFSYIGNLIQEGKIRLRNFQAVAVSHVRRNANEAGDSPAKHALAINSEVY